jgi:DNA-binding XRE family transcriptional regulator
VSISAQRAVNIIKKEFKTMSTHSLADTETTTILGPQFKKLRLERNLSLEELQAEIHIGKRTLKRIENGKCLPFIYLRTLCRFYGKKLRVTLE